MKAQDVIWVLSEAEKSRRTVHKLLMDLDSFCLESDETISLSWDFDSIIKLCKIANQCRGRFNFLERQTETLLNFCEDNYN